MFEWIVARSHILENPRTVLFTVLSVALAVAIILVSMGLSNGFKENLISVTVENNPHITIRPKEGEDYIHLYRTLSKIVEQYPEVEAVSPRLVGKARARYKDQDQSAIFIGADPLREDRLLKVQDDMFLGDYYDLQLERNAAVVGLGLAGALKIRRWDVPFCLVTRNRSIEVKAVGAVETGTLRDQDLVYLPLETAQDLEGKGDVVTQVGVRLYDINAAPSIAADLNARTEYNAQSWQELNRDIQKSMDIDRIYSIIFYILLLIISGFGIADTMIMTISCRTKEIGILMAMGATQRSIMKIFILESAILGPPSALLGGFFALLAAKFINITEASAIFYEGSDISVILDLETFIFVSIFALLVNFLAGIYPAYKASKLDPVEAMAAE